MKHYQIQLADHRTGELIQDAGGACYVAVNGANNKATLTDKTGASLANPVALNNGVIDFYVADTVNLVDLYCQAPGGHFVTLENVGPSGPNEIFIDQGQKMGTMVIPFDIADTTAATETDTGFDEPANVMMLPMPAVQVVDIDATETIDVGTATADSGDPDGYLAVLSVAVAGVIKGTLADGAQTIGALLKTDESAGDFVPEAHVGAAKSIVYELTTGSDTGAGKIVLPFMLV